MIPDSASCYDNNDKDASLMNDIAKFVFYSLYSLAMRPITVTILDLKYDQLYFSLNLFL